MNQMHILRCGFVAATAATLLGVSRLSAAEPGKAVPSQASASVRTLKSSGMERFLAHLSRDLKLADRQKQAVRELLEIQRTNLSTIREASGKQIKTVQAETDKKIRALLNPGQQATFDQYQAKRKGFAKASKKSVRH